MSNEQRIRARWCAAGGTTFLFTVVLFTVLLSSPPAWTLDLGAPGDTRFAAGFFQPEQQPGATFRWSGPDTQLMLHGAGARPFSLDMRLFSPQPPPSRPSSEPTSLELGRDDTLFAAFAPGEPDSWRVYRVLLPPRAVAGPDGNALPLELRSPTYRPGLDDGRDLGVPVDWLRIVPLRDGAFWRAFPLLHALMLTSALALCAIGLHRLATATAPGRRWARWIYAPVGIAALVLASRAAVDPYTLAWALPVAPWSVGLLAALLLLTSTSASTSHAPAHTHDQRASMLTRALLAIILLLALGLRFYRLADLPYGLWRDEARHALVALRLLEDPTYRPIYEPRQGVDLPILGLAPFALALKLWGIHAWTLRTITALAGALTVLPLYGLMHGLFRRRDVALLAAALLAVSSWHVAISRLSFPTIFDPLLTLSGLWLLLRGLTSKQRPAAGPRLLTLAASGLCLGIAAQTYHSGRIAPLLAGALALLVLLSAPRQWRQWLPGAALAVVSFAVTVSPLAGYALRHPDSFNQRVGEVALLSNSAAQGQAPLHALDESLRRHLLMFHLQGDSNGRHHAPGRPLLDMITGGGLLVGSVVLLRDWHNWRSGFLLLALALSLLPGLFAVESPHAMRSIGAAAVACAIAAVGWVVAMEWLAARVRRPQMARFALAAVVVAALLLNSWTYFVVMPADPRVWQASYPIHTQIGSYLRDTADGQGPATLQHIFLPAALLDNPVLLYLTHGLPVKTFSSATLKRAAQPGNRLVLSGYTYQQDVAALRGSLDLSPEPVERGPNLPGTSRPSFVVYEVQ